MGKTSRKIRRMKERIRHRWGSLFPSKAQNGRSGGIPPSQHEKDLLPPLKPPPTDLSELPIATTAPSLSLAEGDHPTTRSDAPPNPITVTKRSSRTFDPSSELTPLNCKVQRAYELIKERLTEEEKAYVCQHLTSSGGYNTVIQATKEAKDAISNKPWSGEVGAVRDRVHKILSNIDGYMKIVE